jgi:hypothetical protein
MKKQKFLFFCCLVAGSSLLGQNNLTMLHHAGTVQIFSGNTGFVDAYNASLSGDTIYLGGGIYNAPTTLSKSLVVYGAGINIDSSTVTGTTTITGPLNFYEGADNSSFQGINTSVTFNNIDIDNIYFRYCKITAITYSGTYTIGTTCDNHQYVNCQLGNTNTSYSDFNTVGSVLIQNCLITQFISNIHGNGLIDHCIFTIGPSYNPCCGVSKPLKEVYNSIISNSKFNNGTGIYALYIISGSNNLFTHNAFNLGYSDVQNTFVGTYTGINDATFFIADPIGSNDYHLQSPGIYPGTDGDQICLYGGDFAWMDGSMPGNPHISSKNIGATSNEDGTLDVDIKINAQD